MKSCQFGQVSGMLLEIKSSFILNLFLFSSLFFPDVVGFRRGGLEDFGFEVLGFSNGLGKVRNLVLVDCDFGFLGYGDGELET